MSQLDTPRDPQGPAATNAEQPADDLGVSRRELLRRAGIGGGAIVAAGVLASSPALAQTPTDPDPSRTGRTPQSDSRNATLATKEYVDARVLRSGDTMSGDLLFSNLPLSTAPRRVGTSTAHHFDLVTDDTLRVRLSAAGDLDAQLRSATFSVAGLEMLLDTDSSFSLRATQTRFFSGANEPLLTLDGATAAFTTPVTMPAFAPDAGADQATPKGYVDDLFDSLRKVPVAQGGLRADGTFEEVFFENDTRVTAPHTIGVRYDNDGNPTEAYGGDRTMNAMTAGPVTVAPGVVITVPNDSVWTVV